jgi:hypothetical protein
MVKVKVKKKGKAIAVRGHESPQGCEMSSIPHFLAQRYSSFFDRVLPNVIFHQVCTPKVVGV